MLHAALAVDTIGMEKMQENLDKRRNDLDKRRNDFMVNIANAGIPNYFVPNYFVPRKGKKVI